jgi:nucleoside-diphosphate-sugar epimerase
MKVLVLGGTGAMGVHLVNLLARQVQRVIVTSRSRSGAIGNIEYVKGDARENAFLKQLLGQQWDVIIDFMLYSTEAFKQRRTLLLSAAGHYVYLSSSRVYASSEEALTEDSPRLLDTSCDLAYLATDEYALSKARQENLLFDSVEKNWTIIRPYITYSDERLQLGVLEKEDWLYRALRKRSIVVSSDINARKTTLTHGRDVARGIVALLGKEQAMGEAFHITANATIAWSEVLAIYVNVLRAQLGEQPRVVLQGIEDFKCWRKQHYQIDYDRLYYRQFNNSKINQYVDAASFTAPWPGLAQCLENFVTSPALQFNHIDWRAEAIKDNFLRERTSLSEIPGVKNKFRYLVSRIRY